MRIAITAVLLLSGCHHIVNDKSPTVSTAQVGQDLTHIRSEAQYIDYKATLLKEGR